MMVAELLPRGERYYIGWDANYGVSATSSSIFTYDPYSTAGYIGWMIPSQSEQELDQFNRKGRRTKKAKLRKKKTKKRHGKLIQIPAYATRNLESWRR